MCLIKIITTITCKKSIGILLHLSNNIAFRISVYHPPCIFTGRMPRHIKFTHRPKIRVFAPQGRLVAPIHVKLRTTDGHLSPLGCAKFYLNRRRGVGMRPQNIKNFHFLVKSRLAWANPSPLSKIFIDFIRLTILQ